MMAETGKGGKGCIALGIHYASYALYAHAHNIQAGYNYAACYFKGPRQLEIDYISNHRISILSDLRVQ